MSISTLPPELLGIIIGHLNTKSVYNLYEAGIVCMQGLVTECQFSINTLATVKSLKSDFFNEVSGCLKVLNLSAVSDLDLPSIIDALKDMHHLTDLDVSYTNIITPDFLQIKKVRPTLKDIGMNFTFGERITSNISKVILLEYQQAFEGCQNVKFVFQPDEDFRGQLAVHMLQIADLLSLKCIFGHPVDFSWYENYNYINIKNMEMVKLSQFQVHLLNGVGSSILDLPLFRLMDFNNYEIAVFSYRNSNYNETEVFATSLISKLISHNFDVKITDLSQSQSRGLFNVQEDIESSAGESVFIFWDRERTTFDDKFKSNLDNIVKEYLLFYFYNDSCDQVPARYKWYSVEHNFGPRELQKVDLDYEVEFEEKNEIRLAVSAILHVRCDVKPKLEINNREFLNKLNHLSISTNMRFHSNFFKNLFQLSESLVTLQLFMEEDYVDPEFFNYIKESKSIKNIYVEGSKTEFSQLFTYLSECRTLENVYLIFVQHINSLPNPRDLFSKCESLCNIYIHAIMPFLSYVEMSRLYKKVRFDLRKYALNIDINNGIDCKYTPYIGVFNIYQLRPM